MRKVALVILILLASPVHAGIFGPSTYEECILENMKGVQSDVAARQIARACRQQFPLPAKADPFDDHIPREQQKSSEPNFFDRFDQDRSENKNRHVKELEKLLSEEK